jgi:hypothetical protein
MKNAAAADQVVDAGGAPTGNDVEELRKDFTVSERVAIGAEVEKKLGERQGERNDLAEISAKSGKTADLAGEKAGFGSGDTASSLGEMLVEQKATVGLAKAGRPKKIRSAEELISTPTLADAGITKKLSSRTERRAAIEAALKARPGESNRAIAADLGVDHKTVGGVRDGLEDIGEIPQSDRVERKGGGTYPARKPRPPRHDPVEIGKVLDARMTAVELTLAKICDKLELEPPPPTPGADWLLVKQAAAKIGYSDSGMRGLIRRKEVATTRSKGGHRLVCAESLKSVPPKV